MCLFGNKTINVFTPRLLVCASDKFRDTATLGIIQLTNEMNPENCFAIVRIRYPVRMLCCVTLYINDRLPYYDNSVPRSRLENEKIIREYQLDKLAMKKEREKIKTALLDTQNVIKRLLMALEDPNVSFENFVDVLEEHHANLKHVTLGIKNHYPDQMIAKAACDLEIVITALFGMYLVLASSEAAVVTDVTFRIERSRQLRRVRDDQEGRVRPVAARNGVGASRGSGEGYARRVVRHGYDQRLE